MMNRLWVFKLNSSQKEAPSCNISLPPSKSVSGAWFLRDSFSLSSFMLPFLSLPFPKSHLKMQILAGRHCEVVGDIFSFSQQSEARQDVFPQRDLWTHALAAHGTDSAEKNFHTHFGVPPVSNLLTATQWLSHLIYVSGTTHYSTTHQEKRYSRQATNIWSCLNLCIFALGMI